MSSVIADSVLAVTHKLVDQAMHGQWQEVPKTVEERRVLLDRLTATASPADMQWLSALKQAMAESDAAVARIAAADSPEATLMAGPQQGVHPVSAAMGTTNSSVSVESTLDMIRKGR
ncbi:MAG: hypothetical protein ACJ8MH_13870 [Povalibacter sp.]